MLRQRLSRLPVSLEIVLVVLITFGPFLYSNLDYWIASDGSAYLTQQHLVALLILEPVLAVIALTFLHLRGWNLGRLRIRPDLKGVFVGIGLAFLAYISYAVTVLAAWTVFDLDQSVLEGGHVEAGISQWTALTVSLLNGFYEEIFVTGYLVSRVKEYQSAWLAVAISSMVRLSYHFYHGAIAVIGLTPLSLLFAGYFSWTGKLWPLIVAHAVYDIAAFFISSGS